MAIIPFGQLVAGTARLAAAEGIVAGLANAVIDSFCQESDDVENWEAATRDGLPGAIARRTQPITRALRRQYCPLNPDPSSPLSLDGSQYGTGGDSFGVIAGYGWYRNSRNNNQLVIEPVNQDIWQCGNNRGLPVGSAFVRDVSSQTIVLSQVFRRADGTEYFQSLTGSIPSEFEEFGFVVTQYNVQACDPSIVPIIPPGVVLPPVPPGTPVPIRPELPITFNLPQLPGFPPIVIPIVYAPITPTLALQPRLTFRPTIQLPGFPEFPDVTLDLGGVSIGGGGEVTIGDIETIINEGGGAVVCPDPCEEVDYEQIREIVFEELDSKLPPKRPNTPASFSTAAANSATITLPPFTVSVTLQMVEPGISVPSQFGGANAPNVVFNGWYSYGVEEETSERIPFNYNQISVPIPPNVRFFSYTITRSGTAAATVRHIIPSP